MDGITSRASGPLVNSGAACPADQAKPRGHADRFHRLEHSSNKVTGPLEGVEGTGRAVCVSRRCNRRTCNHCGPRLGFTVRRNVQSRAPMWVAPCILTLTVDRREFTSPQEAHHRITRGKFIPRLMRLLGLTRWLWVLEFQQKTGDGWPHWHLCIDLAEVGGRLDLSRAWSLWRDTWHLGGLDLSQRRAGMTAEHALNYITKYLTKSPEGGYPEWVLHANSVRFVQGSRSLGRLVGKWQASEEESQEEEQEPEEQDRTGRKSNIEANAKCGLDTSVLREEIDGLTGEIRYRFIGSLPYCLTSLRCWLPDVFQSLPDALRDGRRETLFVGDIDQVRRWCEDHADPHAYRASEVAWATDAILLMNQYHSRSCERGNCRCHRDK